MSERKPFHVQIKVRHYELDTLGHLNHAVYHSYAEVARLELTERAGAFGGAASGPRLAPVLLESRISFRRELRAGDVVDVTCAAKFGNGKTFHMDSNIYKADGTLAAEITCVLGLMDLEVRKLVAEPRDRLIDQGADMTIFEG